MKKILNIIYFLLYISISNAQNNISFENISIPEGLSNGTVLKIYQDSFGYIWLGTQDGLNRYDGINFKVFRDDSNIPNSLVGSAVLDIFEDSRGNLWVGTDVALNLFNRDLEEFEVFQFDPENETQFFNGITAIYEDSNENLWTGKAYHGITFFDRESKTYKTLNIDTSSSIRRIAIFDIEEDKFGNFLILGSQNLSSPGSVYQVNKELTRIVEFTDSVVIDGNKKQFSSTFLNDSENNLWFTTFDGYLIKYNDTLSNFEYKLVKENASIYSSVSDNSGNIWLSTINNQGLLKYNPGTEKITEFLNDPNNPSSISSNMLLSIFIDNSGIFWIGSANKGVNKFDPKKEPLNVYSIMSESPPNGEVPVTSLSEDKNNKRIFIGSSAGLYEFDLKKRALNKSPLSEKFDFPNNNFDKVFVDSENNLWAEKRNIGIAKYNLDNNILNTYDSQKSNDKRLISNNIYTIFEDSKKNIWLGTSYGASKYIREKDKFNNYWRLDSSYSSEVSDVIRSLRIPSKTIASIIGVGDNADLSKEFTLTATKDVLIVSMGELTRTGPNAGLFDYGYLEDSNGNLIWKFDIYTKNYAGGDEKNRLDAKVLNLKPGNYVLRYKSDDSHSTNSWNSTPPSDYNYWGVELYELSKSEVNFFTKNLSKTEEKNSIITSAIGAIYEDSDGNIWLGSRQQGLSILNAATQKFENILFSESSFLGFNANRVNSFLKAEDGKMWIATFGGLIKYDHHTKKKELYTVNDGLSTNYLLDLQNDGSGNIWISSLKGLIKFAETNNGEKPTFLSFDPKDGVQDYTFVQSASIKTSDGELLFGGIKGFNIFKSRKINNIPPKIMVNTFKLSNKIILPAQKSSPLIKSIGLTDSIMLAYNQNDFSFEFIALHFLRSDRNKYAYMLEGFDEEWIYDNRHYASYTNLDPGEYFFKIKASNSDGVWTTEPKSIFINITPPWWKTTAAFATYVLFAVGFFFSFNHLQKRRILSKEREKQKVQEAELRAIAAEAQARVIQAENDRKTKELEEARQLQLSMLPKELPNLPHLDIAVYMKTATEVGGDYYDFHVGIDGTLTVAVGDATGHGLNAGTIVTATKTLFNSHAANPDILFTFAELSRCIKDLRFKLLSMCLTILKIENNKLRFSSAGMPPALIYRSDSAKLEEFVIPGMPLGTARIFPYELRETTLSRGDTILLTSDGLPELFNLKKEVFGYDRVQRIFSDVADKSSVEIIDHLKNTGSNWVDDRDPDDDVTFVVIKVK